MVNFMQIGVGIIMIIVAGVILQVGTNVNAQVDDNFDCTTINSTKGQDACTTTEDNVWLVLQIASYGLLFGGLFIIFAPVMGRFI